MTRTDTTDTDDDEPNFDRILDEILDDVDVWVEAPGPEGPWHWKSLTVYRRMNDIRIYDVDGELHGCLTINTLNDPIHSKRQRLANILDKAHEQSLNRL